MARPRKYQTEELETILRELARRGLTPEQAAGELGVCLNSFLTYLGDAGGKIGSKRFIVMPIRSEELNEDQAAGNAGRRTARPRRQSGDADHYRRTTEAAARAGRAYRGEQQ